MGRAFLVRMIPCIELEADMYTPSRSFVFATFKGNCESSLELSLKYIQCN